MERVGISAIKFEVVRIHFLSGFFSAVAVVLGKLWWRRCQLELAKPARGRMAPHSSRSVSRQKFPQTRTSELVVTVARTCDCNLKFPNFSLFFLMVAVNTGP